MTEEIQKSKKVNAGTSTTPELQEFYSVKDTSCDKFIQSSNSSGSPANTASTNKTSNLVNDYVNQLMKEKEMLGIMMKSMGMQPITDFSITKKLIDNELEAVQHGRTPVSFAVKRSSHEERKFADIIKDKPVKVTVRVLVPIKEHPKFNFVGKLLGPKGNSLRRLQEETMTKMAILGRGSMKDKHKEEELRLSFDPKYSHFNDDLHVEITAFAPPAEAHARIAFALVEVRKFLVPDYNDEIRLEQMREMQIMNTTSMLSSKQQADVSNRKRPSDGHKSTVSSHSSSGTSLITPPPPKMICKSDKESIQQQLTFAQPNGHGSYIYGHQYFIHPAFREIASRAPGLGISGSSVFGASGSFLNRLGPLPHLTTPQLLTTNSHLSPLSLTKQPQNNILSIFSGATSTPPMYVTGPPEENVIGTPCTTDTVLTCSDDGSGKKVVSTAAGQTLSGGHGLCDTCSCE